MCLQDLSSILALALHCHSVFDISHFFIIVLDPFVPLSTIMIQNVSFFLDMMSSFIYFVKYLLISSLFLQFVDSSFNADHLLVPYHSSPMSQH